MFTCTKCGKRFKSLYNYQLHSKSCQATEQCEWFAMCTNDATGTLRHPILGAVPICDRCRAKVDAIDSKTENRK